MSGRLGIKIAGVVAGVAAAGILVGFYIGGWVQPGLTPYRPAAQTTGATPTVHLTLETVAAVGPTLSPNPDWVSYLVRDSQGQWKRNTIFNLPAHALVHVTIYNFDGASGLRNPFLGRPQGLVGPELVDGKPLTVMPPDQPSHTFAVPQLGVLVPIAPVGDNAKNQCGYAPCSLSMAHRTIEFTFRTGEPGTYRWQCFVPCAAGTIDGFGGPMQTVGYMDGFLNVV
ncbi:MAG TPA: hypothetical protein VFL60_05880 [Gaiellaceae bacterium]|nr:hypothetical protein [Gaiellaceae bacterium]